MERLRQTQVQSVQGLLMAGVNALSAPLFSGDQRIAGVVTVVGTEPGFMAEPDGKAAQTLLRITRRISTRMGARLGE